MRALFFILLFGIISCSSYKEPEFKKVENFKLKKLNRDLVSLSADLIYFNANPIGVNLSSVDIDVSVDGISIGKVNQLKEIEITGNNDFTIPVAIQFPLNEIVKKEGLLKSALSVLLEEKATVHYKGYLYFDIAGVKISKSIDLEEEVPLKF